MWINDITKTVRLLIEHGADVKAKDETHTTPLHLASKLGISEIVQLLIKCGGDVTSRDWEHKTPLHMASFWVGARTVLLLIQRMVDKNEQDPSIRMCDKAETVELLIDNGADVTSQDETKSTPLHLASSVGSAKTAWVLIEHGADVAAQDVHRRTPLHLASSWSWVSGEARGF